MFETANVQLSRHIIAIIQDHKNSCFTVSK